MTWPPCQHFLLPDLDPDQQKKTCTMNVMSYKFTKESQHHSWCVSGDSVPALVSVISGSKAAFTPKVCTCISQPNHRLLRIHLKKKLSWYLLRIFSIFLGGKLSSPLLFNVRSFNTAWQSLEAPSSRSWDRRRDPVTHARRAATPWTGTTSAPQKPADLFSRPTGWQVSCMWYQGLKLNFTSWFYVFFSSMVGNKQCRNLRQQTNWCKLWELFYWEFANQKLLVGSHPKKQTESCQPGFVKTSLLGKNHAQTMPRNH